MEQINTILGRTIQTYRKAQGLTLEELADRICKSKSTVGKYEQGNISVDITVLFDIADALGIEPQQLLAGTGGLRSEEQLPVRSGTNRYLYAYDGFSRRMIRGLLVIAAPESSSSPVSLFYDVASLDTPQHCRVLYVGRKEGHETITKYLLRKQGGIDSPQLCVTRPLDYQGIESGIIFGISSRTQLPVSLKCILSDKPLEENSGLVERLHITKEDLRITKKDNQFTVEPGF